MEQKLFFYIEWDFPQLSGNAHRNNLDMMGWNLQSEYRKAKSYFIEFWNRRQNSARLGAWASEAAELVWIPELIKCLVLENLFSPSETQFLYLKKMETKYLHFVTVIFY